ncbi:MAG: MurT ligase domain-containing protein [Candidatus Daviesbacteria bacterium]|nr:MurT ligase domain-containing protein [Candidatus Daviesbacteria bacterium]
MAHMRLFLAILLGKIIIKLTRLLKLGGGSAAPGLYALKIDPELVEKLAKKIPTNIIITGTNGKTTTARMLAHLAKEAGQKVIGNHTGSNLERGIASVLISNYTLYAIRYTLGIWELDESAFNSVVPKIKPDIIIFLNVSRDQLDRYGEVDKVVNYWCKTLSRLNPKTTILINADEPDLAKLKDHFKGKVEEFGKKNLKNVKLNGLAGSSFELSIVNCQLSINLPLPGMYHIYDALAAITCALRLNLPVNKLTNFQPAFGRFEKLPFGYIFLIKNPAGATQVFETIAPQIKPADRLLLALHDNIADGRDVSWIWDASFEEFSIFNFQFSIFCSGTRAYDLAVRLKYAGFDPRQIIIEPDLKKALKEARTGLKGKLFILPTYTAMLELQRILTKQGLKNHYWEEN